MNDEQRTREFERLCREAEQALIAFRAAAQKIRMSSMDELEVATFVLKFTRKYRDYAKHAQRTLQQKGR